MSDRRTIHSLVQLLIRHELYDAALLVMRERCAQDTRFLDRVAQGYIAEGAKQGSLGYQECLRAYAMLDLKLSRRMREQILAAFVSIGFRGHARLIAGSLGRLLTEFEVKTLTTIYANGAVQSRHDMEELCEIAREVGGGQLEHWTLEELRKMDERWANDLY